MRNDSKNMPVLVGALRSTLNRLQEQEELGPDDPALREIKSAILRAMAQREQKLDSGREPTA